MSQLRRARPLALVGAIALLSLSPGAIFAFHGLFPTAYGARAAGMGGAFTAVGGTALDLALNPAHLARNDSWFDASLATNFAELEYNDRYADPVRGTGYETRRRTRPIAPFPALGFTFGHDRWGWGAALYLAGGGGGQYDDLLRAPAADRNLAGESGLLRENVDFRFLLVKFSPGAAYALTDSLRIGFAFDVAYSRQYLDRETRDASGLRTVPGGLHYRSDPAFAPGWKAGLVWQTTPNLKLAYSYEAGLRLPFDGEMRVDSNVAQVPAGARVSRRLRWPDRHNLGAAVQFGLWTVALDARHVAWSQYFTTMRFVLADARIPLPLGVASNQIAMGLRWRDQWVFAAGVERPLGRLILRAGYSYGRTPITSEGASPFLGATTEHHLSGGCSVNFASGTLNAAIEHAFPRRVTGAPSSDWHLSRALIFEEQGVRPAYFSFSRSTKVWTLSLGWQTRL